MSEKAIQFLRELAELTRKHNTSLTCSYDEIYMRLVDCDEDHHVGNIYPGEIPALNITTETP
jgi:hypothetical protein